MLYKHYSAFILLFAGSLIAEGTFAQQTPSSANQGSLWNGTGGLKFHRSQAKIFSGEKVEGDTLIQFDVSYIRTGVLTSDFHIETKHGKGFPLTKGSIAFAVEMELYHSYGHLMTGNNTIEWCIIRDQTEEKGKEDRELHCVIKDNDETGRFIRPLDDFDYHPTFFDMPFANKGPLPPITEQEITLPTPFTRQLVIDDISNSRIKLKWTERDSNNNEPERRGKVLTYKWPKNHETVEIENDFGTFLFKRVDKKTVSVTQTHAIPVEDRIQEKVAGPNLFYY